MPGKELFALHEDQIIDQLNKNNWLLLSHKLLSALREQVVAPGIVHRDLKLENIIVQLEPEIIVNIIDYGAAKKNGSNNGNYPGTYTFAAPEIFDRKKHDYSCDIYSMGKVIAALWIGSNFYDAFLQTRVP